MMKADVLSGFDSLKIATTYNYKGNEISQLPFNIEQINTSVNYIDILGWQEDITGTRNINKIPKKLKDSIKLIENFVEVPVSIISVGPDRKETVFV